MGFRAMVLSQVFTTQTSAHRFPQTDHICLHRWKTDGGVKAGEGEVISL